MRYVRIFLLNFQYLLSHRSRPLVYIFTYVFNSLLFLAFMRGVFVHSNSLNGLTLYSVTGYYFLLIPVAGTLMTHPEIPVLRDDIEKGEFASRILKPLSYYWQWFYHEIPVRTFQSIVGFAVFIFLSYLFKNFLQINFSVERIALTSILILLAFFISFTFKMILAISALWTTDIRGLRELSDVVILIFAGYLVPVNLLPVALERTAYILPFSYMIYFPVIAIQGKLPIQSLVSVISIQVIWLLALTIIFRYFWKRGLKRFTDLGQ